MVLLEKKALWPFNRAQLPQIIGLLLLAFLGVILLGAGSFFAKKEAPPTPPPPALETGTLPAEASAFEKKLEAALSTIAGAGEVKVTVMFTTGPEYTYVTDEVYRVQQGEEKVKEGGTRTTTEENTEEKTVLVRSQGGGEQPVILKKKEGEIGGVLVIAEGARDPEVRLTLTRAVVTLLGVAAHRVEVFPKENGGGINK